MSDKNVSGTAIRSKTLKWVLLPGTAILFVIWAVTMMKLANWTGWYQTTISFIIAGVLASEIMWFKWASGSGRRRLTTLDVLNFIGMILVVMTAFAGIISIPSIVASLPANIVNFISGASAIIGILGFLLAIVFMFFVKG